MAGNTGSAELLEWTAKIVAAHLRHNTVAVSDLAAMIRTVYGALSSLVPRQAPAPPPQPAVPVRRSVTPDYIVCLEDGRKLKMLKRHLMTAYHMTPDEYRKRWGLPPDYPMVAPNYARQRSRLAKKIGLGRRGAAPAARPAG